MSAGAAGPARSFWDFSLSFYARPGIPPACLGLQDEGGADVNVVLYLLRLAELGRRLAAEDVGRVEGLVATWREDVVRGLRDVRRAMKCPSAGFDPEAVERLRTEVKRVELAAERLQQETMERLLPAAVLGVPASREEAARANLAHYAARLGGLPAAPLAVILDAFLGAER